MNRTVALTAALAIGLLSGCSKGAYLQYDHGRSTTAAFLAQSDLTRPGVIDADYPMSGSEAQEIRLRQVEATTDAESGETEATSSVATQ